MTPASLIPRPEPLPLPAPPWLFWGLLMLTLILHILAMNLFVGSSVLAAYVRIRHRTNRHARDLADRLARPLPVFAAATITLGVAPLLFLQVLYGRLFFASSVLMAWAWLAVVPALILAYYGAYAVSLRAGARRPAGVWLHVALAVVLLGIGLVYTTNMTLMLRADRFAALYAAAATGLHFGGGDPTIPARWIHMMLGAVAVAGVAVALLGASRAEREPDFAGWAQQHGARWSAVATGVNLLAGLWFLLRLPWPIVQQLVAGSVTGSVLFGGALALALGAFTLLVVASSVAPSPRLSMAAAGAVVATVVGMVFVRDLLRQAWLGQNGFEPLRWVQMQWLAFGVFAVLLAAAVGTVAWMARALFVASAAPTEARAKVA